MTQPLLCPGAYVAWDDPDNGECSRTLTIREISRHGDMVRLYDTTFNVLECLEEELRVLPNLAVPLEHIGITRGNLQYLHLVDEIGDIQCVKGWVEESSPLYALRGLPLVLVEGTEGRAIYHGLNWGYGGEGPRGLITLLNHFLGEEHSVKPAYITEFLTVDWAWMLTMTKGDILPWSLTRTRVLPCAPPPLAHFY